MNASSINESLDEMNESLDESMNEAAMNVSLMNTSLDESNNEAVMNEAGMNEAVMNEVVMNEAVMNEAVMNEAMNDRMISVNKSVSKKMNFSRNEHLHHSQSHVPMQECPFQLPPRLVFNSRKFCSSGCRFSGVLPSRVSSQQTARQELPASPGLEIHRLLRRPESSACNRATEREKLPLGSTHPFLSRQRRKRQMKTQTKKKPQWSLSQVHLHIHSLQRLSCLRHPMSLFPG